jgi:hypothetical protein
MGAMEAGKIHVIFFSAVFGRGKQDTEESGRRKRPKKYSTFTKHMKLLTT